MTPKAWGKRGTDDPLTHAAYRDESACSSHVVTSVPG
jgi:hypothetical protein